MDSSKQPPVDGHEGITIDYRNCSIADTKRSSMRQSDKLTIQSMDMKRDSQFKGAVFNHKN